MEEKQAIPIAYYNILVSHFCMWVCQKLRWLRLTSVRRWVSLMGTGDTDLPVIAYSHQYFAFWGQSWSSPVVIHLLVCYQLFTYTYLSHWNSVLLLLGESVVKADNQECMIFRETRIACKLRVPTYQYAGKNKSFRFEVGIMLLDNLTKF